jgi:starch phosphorylase
VVFARDRIGKAARRAGAGEGALLRAEDALSPSALTLSFARRFATYKRGNLLLRDPDRLLRLLSDKDRPLQIIFAGKAHPNDIPGKSLIKELVHFSRKEEVQSRIIFLEDYDMTMSRYLTSGSDVWLNTPRRPLEASGTSGMKAGMNGVLNCSVLDGWWAEAFRNHGPSIGWAIGSGEMYSDEELQDDIESQALYDLLEREIIPLFYQRGRDGLPREWIKRMKASMRFIGAEYSSHRMLKEYSERFYLPALENYRALALKEFAPSKDLARYVEKLRSVWQQVTVQEFRTNAMPVMQSGEVVTITAMVDISSLDPSEILVELYHGNLTSQGEFIGTETMAMKAIERRANLWEYRAAVPCVHTGQQGYAVRLLPSHAALVHPFMPGLIRWAT